MIPSALERGCATVPGALVGRQLGGTGTAEQEGEAGDTLDQLAQGSSQANRSERSVMRGHVTKADARRPVGCMKKPPQVRCDLVLPVGSKRAGLGGPAGVLGDGRGQMSRGLLHLRPFRMGCAKTACGEFLC